MAEKTLKEKTANGLLWGVLNNGMMQLFNLAFGIILGNLLTPKDYGMVGVLAIFSGIAGALQEGGFISALNQRKEVTQEDYNAVFWFSSAMSIGLYALGFCAAPLIATLFKEPQLVWLSRYVFLGFLLSGWCIVPKAVLFRQMRVRETSTISICALLLSGCVGVAMAFMGWAYWGIATQGLVYVAVIMVLSFWRAGWTPRWSFRFAPLREMFGFGSKLVVTNLFTVLNNNLLSFLLGVSYTKVDVGNFTQANKWNTMGNSTITGMLNGITQPLFTKVNDSAEEQIKVFRKLLRFTAFLSFPAMFGLGLVAEELIVIAIGEKWRESAHLLQLLCLWGAIVPLTTLFSNYLIARGRSDIYLCCTMALAGLQIVTVIAASPWGMKTMFSLYVLLNILWLGVWHRFVRREIALPLRHVLLDLAPYALLAGALSLGAHYVFQGIDSLIVLLLAKVVTVGTTYLLVLHWAGSVILRESITYFLRKRKK